ncbi:MAG: sel1 repeat family protein [Thermoguttaceae bacterium]|nr:sel1 repeat family protein [Thermoguttaceae bacterium]
MNISGKNWSRRTILVASLSALCAAFVGCGGTDSQGGGSGETSTDATSMWQEGRRLTFGLDGSKVDSKRGVELLQKAADAGSLDAQADLATIYDWPDEFAPMIARDEKKAIELALKPAEAGNPFAQLVLIEAFPEDVGGEELRAKYSKTVLGELEKRAEKGDAHAKLWIGRIMHIGGEAYGIQQPDIQQPDREKAKRYLVEAVESGSAEAMSYLGRTGILSKYEPELSGLVADKNEAMKYLQKAADANAVGALMHYAECCLDGTVEQDSEKAVALLRRAAEQGSVSAKALLGVCYAEGLGVSIDKKKAFEYFLDAAKSEYAAEYERRGAMMKVGECYEEGVGVEEDKDEARKWYHRAAAAGALDADEALERLDAN